MNPHSFQEMKAKKAQLQSATDELEELKEQLRVFEAQVDQRLGSLLDQLGDLRAETSELEEELRNIRERRLFGEDLIRYLDGAPRPARSHRMADLPSEVLRKLRPEEGERGNPASMPGGQIPDIRMVYRKLARRYHPDLARSDADRAMCNEQMAEINQVYREGNLESLMRMAGMDIPLIMLTAKPATNLGEFATTPVSEQDELESNLKSTRQEIARLSRLPIVKLSLDVKLARHQRRDLLTEMAAELDYKIKRKMAERDYLDSQIYASLGGDERTSAGE